jgi:hypothetical protein
MKKLFLIIGIIALALALKAQVSEQEFQALKAFYNATGGDTWTNRTGWENINTTATKNDVTTSWKGISGIYDGHVTDINFYNNNLTGSLPEEMVGLDHLKSIGLNSNHMTGPLPQALKKLTKLNTFSMAGSQLNIPFPSDFIECWPNLVILNLGSCGITGTLPDIFDKTPLLWSLQIDNNNIKGTLPKSLNNLNLNEFHCSNNMLEGELPELTNTKDIYRISFSNNNFTGSIPEHYGDFVLQYFLIDNNKLSGTIPEKLFETPIYLFNIQENFFTFAHLEPVLEKIKTSTYYYYATSKKLPVTTNMISINKGEPLTLDASSLSVYNPGGSHNRYKWFCNNIEVYSGNSSVYSIPSARDANSGTYRFEVTNTAVTDLTLKLENITIQINKVNSNPTNISITSTTVNENYAGTIGALSATDPDAGDTLTFLLATGDGFVDKDNGRFSILNNQLIINEKADYETLESFNILIGVTDGNGGTFAKAFSLTVNNINEPPVFSGQLTEKTIDENAENGVVVLPLLAIDPENDPITFSITRGNENDAFRVSGNELIVANHSSLDYETKNSYDLTIRASDTNLSTEINLQIRLKDVDEKYAVTSTVLPLASGTTNITDGLFESGTSVSITATPSEGYAFVNWTENNQVISVSDTLTFIINSTRSFVANFRLKTYTVTLSTNNPSAGYTNFASKSYNHGEKATINAQPNWQYRFVNWTEDGQIISNESKYSFFVNDNHTMVANFEKVTGASDIHATTITISPNPSTDYISLSGVQKGNEILITSISGSIIKNTVAESSVQKIDVTQLNKGIYLVIIRGSENVITKKILIE